MTTTRTTTNKITSILTSSYATSAIVTTSASSRIAEETTNSDAGEIVISSTIDKIHVNGETTDRNIVNTIYSTAKEATGSNTTNFTKNNTVSSTASISSDSTSIFLTKTALSLSSTAATSDEVTSNEAKSSGGTSSTTHHVPLSNILMTNNSYEYNFSTSSTKLVNSNNSTTPYVHYLLQQLQGSLKFYFDNNSNQSTQLINILSSYSFNLTPCLVNCSNRGQCVLGSNFELICQCTSSHFTGDSCQYDVRPCSTNKCLYNGTCMNLNNNTQFKCECSQNYYGANCEKQIDACKMKNVTCSSQGYCLNQDNGTAICKCFLNFYGDNCEFQDAFVKVIKNISVSSLVVLLTSIGLFVLWVVSNDIMNIFITKSRYGENKRQEKSKIIRFKYTPFKKNPKK